MLICVSPLGFFKIFNIFMRLRTHRAHHGIRACCIIIGVATGVSTLIDLAIVNFIINISTRLHFFYDIFPIALYSWHSPCINLILGSLRASLIREALLSLEYGATGRACFCGGRCGKGRFSCVRKRLRCISDLLLQPSGMEIKSHPSQICGAFCGFAQAVRPVSGRGPYALSAQSCLRQG